MAPICESTTPAIVSSRRSSSCALGPVEGRAQAFEALDVGHQGGAHDRLEQLLLALEVEVERALADARARRDVLEPGGGEAALGEARQRRRQDLLGPRLLAALPAGPGSLFSWSLPSN